VRGITIKHPDVEPAHRGTFAGLASPAMIDYLVGLGVTDRSVPTSRAETRTIRLDGIARTA
jgi:hypothetical protein